MAFARKLPFAKRWAKQTNFAALPEKKDAGTDAGPSLHGPGGLLGTPGMGTPRKGRKWGNRTKNKNCTCGVNFSTKEQIAPGITRIRGNLCNVHGRYGPCDASLSGKKKPKGRKAGAGRAKKPKKPVLTPEQRAAAREKKQAENRKKALGQLGIAPDGQAALEALRSGKQPDPAALARGGFEKAGLVERAEDGSYRLTASGRAALNAASQGDVGRAGDTISAARDRLGARQGRQAAAEQRKQTAAERRNQVEERRKKAAAQRQKKQGGGGGKQSTNRQAERQQRQQRQAEHEADRARRQREHEQDRARRLAEHEQDRARREAERQQRLGQTAAPPAPKTAPVVKPSTRVDLSRPGVQLPARKRGRSKKTNIATRTKSVLGAIDHLKRAMAIHQQHLLNPTAVPSRASAEAEMGHIQAALAELEGTNMATQTKAVMSVADQNNLPDSAFLFIESGGKKDADGKTVPRSLRHFPYKNANGGIDLPHLRNAIARIPQSNAKGLNKEALQKKARALLEKANANQKSFGAARWNGSEWVAIPNEKSFAVFKSADGSYRWIARSTTAYRDRDGEIITTKALEQDADRMTATGQYGPLRYWHIGQPDPFDPVKPWGPGVDIGDCDYSIVIGLTSIESGTFKSQIIGKAFAESADDYEISPGFFHPPDEPNNAGEYDNSRRFERSVVPIKYGRASNLFTGLTVKEFRMDQNEYERRMKAFAADMQGKGVPPEVSGAIVAGMEQADKSAQAQGIAYKSDDAPADPWAAVLTALKAAVAPQAAEKADMAPASMEQAGATEMADGEMEAGTDEEAPEETEYIGDMSIADFEQLLTSALQAAIQSFGSDIQTRMAAMDEAVKGMGYARTKAESANAAEIAKLKARLAQLEGDQPAVVNPDDVEAALKGAPQSPPDPTKPMLPADATPIQRLAAQTMPQLYQQNPDGTFGGWNPFPVPPQSNS